MATVTASETGPHQQTPTESTLRPGLVPGPRARVSPTAIFAFAGHLHAGWGRQPGHPAGLSEVSGHLLANRGWGWEWTPDPRRAGDRGSIPDPRQIGDGDGDGDRGFRALLAGTSIRPRPTGRSQPPARRRPRARRLRSESAGTWPGKPRCRFQQPGRPFPLNVIGHLEAPRLRIPVPR